jgi:hypothetical protein
MVRPFVITWLFAALRMNEILRLRLGCIRWQREGVVIPETRDSLAADAVCFIDIPVNKTSTEYTSPSIAWSARRLPRGSGFAPPKRSASIPKPASWFISCFLAADSSWEELSE